MEGARNRTRSSKPSPPDPLRLSLVYLEARNSMTAARDSKSADRERACRVEYRAFIKALAVSARGSLYRWRRRARAVVMLFRNVDSSRGRQQFFFYNKSYGQCDSS